MTTQSNDVVADLQRRISECDHERCEDCELMAPAIALIKSLEYALTKAMRVLRGDEMSKKSLIDALDAGLKALALARGDSTGDGND